MLRSHVRRTAWMMALMAGFAFGQVPLPAAWTGPWERGPPYPPAGWTFFGLGLDMLPDYDGLNDGAARLQNTGSYIAVHYDGPAAAVSYWIRGLTFSGGVFRVEQSVDGSAWADLHVYTNPPPTATFHTRIPDPAARHVRFIYSEKVTGNVGVDGITIAKGGLLIPRIERIDVSGGTATVRLADSILLQPYALEWTTALDAAPPVDWTVADVQAGTGGPLPLTDAAAAASSRFYRVRATE